MALNTMARSQPARPSSFEALRQHTAEIIKKKSFSRGRFVLASGRVSDYYLDMKPTMFDPEGAKFLAELVLCRLEHEDATHIGGLEMGAVPLVATATMLSYNRGRPWPGFFVRKAVKDHGTKRKIEGSADVAGKRVIVLDDVTTTGESAFLAVEAVQDAGATVALVLSVVDRQEGAAEFYARKGILFDCLFTARDFMSP